MQRSAPDARAAHAAGHVGGDHEQRRPRRERLADRGQGVGRAGPGRHDGDPEAAAGTGVAVGRVRGGLLVAHPDEPDRRLLERPPEREVVHARQSERHLDAGRLERPDYGVRPCQHALPCPTRH